MMKVQLKKSISWSTFALAFAACMGALLAAKDSDVSDQQSVFLEPSKKPVRQLPETLKKAPTLNAADASLVRLQDVWAFNTPGTRQLVLRSLRPNSPTISDEARLTEGIYNSLYILKPDAKLGSAFAVSGVGLEALENAFDVMVKKKKSTKIFSTDSDVSIVFFAAGRGSHAHLQEVERRGDLVSVRYKFVPHLMSPQTSLHFAIIPLGKLSTGIACVDIMRIPTDKKLLISPYKEPSKEQEAFMVCKSFEFSVKKSLAR